MQGIKLLRKAIVDIDATIMNYPDTGPSIEEACDALLQLNLAKRDTSLAYDSLAAYVGHLMEESQKKDMSLNNGAQIERKVAYDRKGWRHQDLALDVARRLSQSSVDMDTGEVTMNPQELVVKLLDYVQPSYWRVGELGKIGINADNYCETGEPKVSLIVRKGENQ
jgi:hypothetical protein